MLLNMCQYHHHQTSLCPETGEICWSADIPITFLEMLGYMNFVEISQLYFNFLWPFNNKVYNLE